MSVSNLTYDIRIRTGGSNRKRTSQSLDLIGIHETWVCHVTHIHTLAASHEPSNIFGTKAVSNSTNLLHTLVLLHVLDDLLHDWVDLLLGVALGWARGGQPLHDVKVIWAVERDWVALEEIGHDDVVAISGELVGDELGVVELVADDVGEDEDRGGGVLRLWVGEVG